MLPSLATFRAHHLCVLPADLPPSTTLEVHAFSFSDAEHLPALVDQLEARQRAGTLLARGVDVSVMLHNAELAGGGALSEARAWDLVWRLTRMVVEAAAHAAAGPPTPRLMAWPLRLLGAALSAVAAPPSGVGGEAVRALHLTLCGDAVAEGGCLAELLRFALPPSVAELHLELQRVPRAPAAEVARLPRHVTALHLWPAGGCLAYDAELARLARAAPPHVERVHVHLSAHEVARRGAGLAAGEAAWSPEALRDAIGGAEGDAAASLRRRVEVHVER